MRTIFNYLAAGCRRLAGYLLTIALTAALLCATGPAWAARFDIDPFSKARAEGKTIFELESVEAALYGGDSINVRDVFTTTLRLGSRDRSGTTPLSYSFMDINGDGVEDLLALFLVSNTGLIKGTHIQAVLSAALQDGSSFKAFDSVVTDDSDDPTDYCTQIIDGLDTVGIRCSFTTSFADDNTIDLSTFIATINSDSGASASITDSSAVVVELFGGQGHDGERVKDGDTYCTPGDGGGRGYAQTVLTVSDLKSQTVDSTNLYVYVGEDGTGDQDGSTSSLLMGNTVIDVTDATDPSSEKVVAIAGGGGGGGKASKTSQVCKKGGDGGAGGSAIADTSGAASVAGSNAPYKYPGQGGNQDGSGSAGTGEGEDGTSGIGGLTDSNSDLIWAGWEFPSSVWTKGRGGNGGSSGKGGGGGGGFGGGSGGGGKHDHKGGGGGGGSWAMQATVDSSTLDSLLVLGSSYDAGQPMVVLTFELDSSD